MLVRIVVVLLLAGSAFSTANSAEILVPGNIPTIQGAIDAAVDGDVILVAPGTYPELINFSGKIVRVESESGPEVTIIDGGAAGTVVTFAGGENRDAVLRGFTITNGFGFEGGGIGVFNSSPSVEKNIITANVACEGAGIGLGFASPLIMENSITGNSQGGCSGGFGGGGISIRGASTPEIIGNLISENQSGSGAGLSLFAAGNPVIRDNEISNNISFGEGGGLVLANQSDALIVQNLIYGNTAAKGGGISWLVPASTPGPRVVNNTIAGNDAPTGSGIFADGYDDDTLVVNNIVVAGPGQTAIECGDFNNLAPPVLQYNLVYSPTGTAYGGICDDQTGANGNITGDPLFTDDVLGDFRLELDSPAVDAANDAEAPLQDYSGNVRPVDGDGDGVAESDIGALELVGPFRDVPPRYWAVAFVASIADSGITSGCGNENFCPENLVTRAQMAVFLERGINGSGFTPPPATGQVFLDVAATDFAAAFIERLFADGITGGCGGGRYCPANPVTRAQMAVFLLRAKYGAAYKPPLATGIFADVPPGSFAADWIEQLAADGITTGCGGGNFCPSAPVTRAQMSVFLVRTFGL